MKIWQLDNESNVQLSVDNDTYFKYFDGQFKGKPIDTWGEIKVILNQGKENCDSPSFVSGKPIFGKKAVEILQPFLKDVSEILPLQHSEYIFFAINVTNVVDCIDYEKATVHKLRTGRITGFDKYAFQLDKVKTEFIFKIPELLNTRVFVSDHFRNIVIQNELIGFKFIEVWDSVDDPSARKEQDEQLRLRLVEIEQQKGQEYSWTDAMAKVNSGAAIASGKWKIQQNKKGIILLGELLTDGQYLWMDPSYYPPILLDLKYHIVEKSDV